MRITQMLVVALLLLAGCGGGKEPVMAHGKPVTHWVNEAKKPDAKARQKAVVALGHVGTADPAALPALIAAVKDSDAGVRRAAVLALLNIGPAAKDAVPALREAKNDSDPTVRSHAARALEVIQGEK
jgi:HEAT repeat protein